MLLRIALLGALFALVTSVNLPGIPTDFNQNVGVLASSIDDVARKFENEYMNFLKTGSESAVLKQMSTQLSKSHSKKDIFVKEITELSSADQYFVCVACRSAVNVLIRELRNENELSEDQRKALARKVTLDICDRLQMQTAEVCGGLFESHWEFANYLLEHSEMDSKSFCSIFMEIEMCGLSNVNYNWTLTIDGGVSEMNECKIDTPKKTDDDLYILQISDLHHDPLYVSGSLAECEEPLCCQRGKETVEGTAVSAGEWGDYRDCDAPLNLITNTLDQTVKSETKFEAVYVTGDTIDHGVWITSIEKNKQVLKAVNDLLIEKYPNTKVYPTIGNHEPHPLNLFSPSDVDDSVSTYWLYEYLYTLWSKWLPAETKETIVKGGYYTVLHKEGFRIISLNNNDCYTRNWWMLFRGTTPMLQLQWLHDTLLQAEKNKERVHILAHIPSGDGTYLNVCSREYNRLIERFCNTISGIFNGHSHKDELQLHYSQKGHPMAVSWNGGSVTTYSNKNPNYKIYEVEPKNMHVVDFKGYIFNLTLANENPSKDPDWFLEYEFAKEFTDDLSPEGIHHLLNEMAEKPDILRKFWEYKMTSADPMMKQGCNRHCLVSTICRMATSVNDQKTRCNELSAKLHESLDKEETVTEKPGGGGAGALAALSFTTLMAFVMASKYFL